MLKIFCGYGLEDLETCHELDICHYMHESDVIKLCEDFLNDIQPFGDDVISIKTNGTNVKSFIEMKTSKSI